MDDDELDILAWTMLGEAGGEGTQGMADVGHVVLNRLNTGRYGSSLTDVALAPKQFSTWNSGSGGNDPKGKYPKDSREFQRARQLASQVVSGEIPGPPGRPLDYNASNISPYWADSKAQNGTYTRNGHTFYPSVPVPPGELPEVASLQDTRRPTPPPAVPPRRPDGDSRLHPFDAATNTPRPNADGSVSTEVTRTVQLPDGNAVNVPSLWWGQGSSVRDFGSMSDDQLADFAMRYEQQSGNGFPRYGGIPEAERAAIARSNEGGGTKGPITYPGSLVAQTFNQLPRPGGNNAGDSLAMNPVQGGNQQAPMFDGIYDERVNAVRPSGEPIDTQGMATMRSRAPAPVPASPFDRVTARLNALPAQALLPEIPPPSVGGAPTTRAVQSVPMPPPRMQVSASDMARGRNGWETIASIPSTPAPTAFSASDMTRGLGVPPVIDRLAPSAPGMPSLYGGGFTPEQVAQIGVPAMPEIPGAPRTRMASAAPFPMPRPSFMPSVGTALSVQPMPPMPIARPQMAQQRRAPVPMPLSMRPQQQRAPLRITVQRDQQQSRPTPQGFTESGNGRLVSNEYGDTYYSRHLR